jgi:hypothetical protein
MGGLRCIVYQAHGRICGRLAIAFTPRLGGWTCPDCNKRLGGSG